ncbi:MAG: phospholipase D-like domain-containing protein, partial [Planctomycetota bacterium]|nr:phospholipase D-like domain-containing protein [Planctomycetota bacterium]
MNRSVLRLLALMTLIVWGLGSVGLVADTKKKSTTKKSTTKKSTPKKSTSKKSTTKKVDESITTYFSPTEKLLPALASQILSAKKTIDIAMYSLSIEETRIAKPRKGRRDYKKRLAAYNAYKKNLAKGQISVYDALWEIARKGVKIRMVFHHAHLGAWKTFQSRQLERAKVDVRFTTRTMHEKFGLIDGKRLIVGSANWSHSAALIYNEYTSVFEGYDRLVDEFEKEFKHLWGLSRGYPVRKNEKKPTRVPAAPKGGKMGTGLEVYFSSSNAGKKRSTVLADQIIDIIKGAKKSIRIGVAHFNYDKIGKALIAAKKKNSKLDIRVLVDFGEYKNKNSYCDKLEKAGVPVRYKLYSLAYYHFKAQLQHHKFIVADGTDLACGSYNWSETAELSNFENLMVFSGSKYKSLSGKFTKEFDRLWKMNRTAYAPFKKAMLSRKGS